MAAKRSRWRLKSDISPTFLEVFGAHRLVFIGDPLETEQKALNTFFVQILTANICTVLRTFSVMITDTTFPFTGMYSLISGKKDSPWNFNR